MEQARKTAYEEGKKAGYTESQNSTAQSMLALIKSMQVEFAQLLSHEEKREKIFENEVLTLNAAIFKKIAPKFAERYNEETMKEKNIRGDKRSQL